MIDYCSGEQLAAAGFQDSATVRSLLEGKCKQVPALPGVYIVVSKRGKLPVFCKTSPAGWLKMRDPTLPIRELEEAWIIDTSERLALRIKQLPFASASLRTSATVKATRHRT